MCGYVYVRRRAIQCISCILKLLSGSAKNGGKGKQGKGMWEQEREGWISGEGKGCRRGGGGVGDWNRRSIECKIGSSKAGNVPHTLPFYRSKKCTPYTLCPHHRGEVDPYQHTLMHTHTSPANESVTVHLSALPNPTC